jgi:hypothetical protein
MHKHVKTGIDEIQNRSQNMQQRSDRHGFLSEFSNRFLALTPAMPSPAEEEAHE